MLLKSFCRKKTTIIYLLIFILIFSCLGTVIIGRNYYAEQADLNTADSYIYMPSFADIETKSIPNVKNYKRVLSDGRYYYDYNNELNENEILFPNSLNKKYQLNSPFEFKGIKNNFTFTIIGYHTQDGERPILYINKDTFENLRKNGESYGYLLTLNTWNQTNYEVTANYILDTYNIESFGMEINKANIDFTQHIKSFTAYVYIITIIFIIACAFTIYNILNDEKEKNYIYRSLGYSKHKIFKLQLINISSLFILSLLFSSLLITIVRVIFKL